MKDKILFKSHECRWIEPKMNLKKNPVERTQDYEILFMIERPTGTIDLKEEEVPGDLTIHLR